MARAQATDPLHNFRFHARAGAVAGLNEDPLQPTTLDSIGETAEAGFQAITSPELTAEVAEYREGLLTYTQKYPGIPTTNDVTFNRGVARFDTAFFQWVTAAVEGREYRSDVTYLHALREGRTEPFNAVDDFANASVKRYILRQAFPIRVKLAGDLDASTSDVSIAEMDVAYEKPEMVVPAA